MRRITALPAGTNKARAAAVLWPRCLKRLAAPVSLHPVPATAFMTPVSRDPYSAPIRRLRPVAGDPDIPLTIPAMMPPNPHPAGVRTRSGTLDNGWGRTNADIDMLRKCGRQAQQRCRSNEKQLLHSLIVPFERMHGVCRLRTSRGTQLWPGGCGNIFSREASRLCANR